MDCVFCKINNNEIPSKTIYEDNVLRVIMDNNPVSNGHVLILTKDHFKDFSEVDSQTISHIHEISKKIKSYLEDSLKPEGITILNNYGINQVVKHYHLHLIPVYNHNNLNNIDDIYAKIKRVI